MASRYWRVLDLRKLAASQVQPRDQYIDAGAFKVLEVDCRVPSLGTGGSLKLQHAAVPEEDAFRDLASFTLSGGAPGGYTSVGNFLRYLRWATDAAVAGNPQAMMDLVAKE